MSKFRSLKSAALLLFLLPLLVIVGAIDLLKKQRDRRQP